eukprot:4941382-Pleurochrysis_carterae.AAC.1
MWRSSLHSALTFFVGHGQVEALACACAQPPACVRACACARTLLRAHAFRPLRVLASAAHVSAHKH